MNGYPGYQQPNTYGSDYNSQYEMIKQILSTVHTAILCQVTSVTNNGSVSLVGSVNLQPLVNQVGATGIQVSQGALANVPYFRLQGGSNAVIIDPQVGDIGVAIFCERDISSVIKNKAQSNPGSNRQYNISDGLYLGGFLNAAPTQYIQFNSSGITIFSPYNINIQATGNVNVTAGGNVGVTASGNASINASGSISATAGTTATLTAPAISLMGNTTVTGNFSFSGTGQNAGVDIGSTHKHPMPGIQSGTDTGETGAPNA